MNDIWLLFVKTTLPDEEVPSRDMKTFVSAFDGFEKARAAFRKTIKDLAFSENPMFDGDGRIKYLDEYVIDDDDDDDDDDVDDFLSAEKLSLIQNALREAFYGNDAKLEIADGDYDDGLICVEIEDGTVNFYGEDDGPMNGYDPTIKTNIFDMSEEKDYYLYIEDMLGQYDDWTSELYIDLKKVTVE